MPNEKILTALWVTPENAQDVPKLQLVIFPTTIPQSMEMSSSNFISVTEKGQCSKGNTSDPVYHYEIKHIAETVRGSLIDKDLPNEISYSLSRVSIALKWVSVRKYQGYYLCDHKRYQFQ